MAKSGSRRRNGRMCAGKVGYEDRAAALAAVYGTRRSNEQKGEIRATHLRAYACRCGKWHIGHSRRLDWRYLEKFI